MPSIRELVSEVEERQASAFSVLGGEPVMMTINGSSEAGKPFSEADINGIVEADLNQDQQTDIMVGRPVGLSLEIAGATWRVLVQPMPTGIVLRGTREGEPSSGAPASAPAAPVPDSFRMPVDDDEIEMLGDNPPTPPPGSLDAFERRGVPTPVDDPSTPPPAAMDAFDTPVQGLSLAQDDGFGMVEAPEMPAEEREITLFENANGSEEAVGGIESTLLQAGGAVQVPPPEPTDPNAGGGMADGTLIMQHAPKINPEPVPASSEKPTLDDPGDILLADSSAEHPENAPTRRVRRADTASPRKRNQSSGTLMAMRPPGMGSKSKKKQTGKHPSRSPSRSLPRMETGQFPRSEELEVGALCFCRDLKEAFEAGGRMGMGVEVIAESDVHDGRGPSIDSLGIEAGATLIVNIDDPSRLLGWVLLRREEGFRVFVVTRATGPAGARRILLGIHATDRAEEWLDAHPVYALVGGEYQGI